MVTALVTVTLLLQTASGTANAPAAAAIVSTLQGSASARTTGSSPQPLKLFDWIKTDATVDVAPAGRLELILIDGHRYTLGGGARVLLSSGALTTVRGEVRAQPAMPQLVALTPIAAPAPRAAGAVRVRGRGVTKLNPCQGVRTLRERTILQFETVEGAARYQVEVRDSSDTRVFARTIDRPPLTIPSDVLTAGTQYVWTVRSEGTIPPATSEATFSTLDAQAEAARRSLATSPEVASIGLLGGIDIHLRLLNEAIAELTDASQRTPHDTATVAALERARATLAGACQ
jgi:hypothetical protein